MDIEQLKSELRALGFSEDKLNELLDIAAQEAMDTALEDLAANADEIAMDELANTLDDQQPIDATSAAAKINLIFQKAYGANADAKKQELILTFLKQTIDDTKKAKDIYARYQAGDPTAIAAVQSQDGNPDVQKVVDMM